MTKTSSLSVTFIFNQSHRNSKYDSENMENEMWKGNKWWRQIFFIQLYRFTYIQVMRNRRRRSSRGVRDHHHHLQNIYIFHFCFLETASDIFCNEKSYIFILFAKKFHISLHSHNTPSIPMSHSTAEFRSSTVHTTPTICPSIHPSIYLQAVVMRSRSFQRSEY